jgi:hypothetical protein
VLAHPLEDLRGGIGIRVEHADNLRLERIEFTGPWPRLPGPEALLGEPVGDGARIEGQGGRNLRGTEALLLVEVFDPSGPSQSSFKRATYRNNATYVFLGALEQPLSATPHRAATSRACGRSYCSSRRAATGAARKNRV